MALRPTRLWPDSATIMERSRGVFFAQWTELLRLRRVVIKTPNQDDIHDLRVASRRVRAALDLFYPFVAKGPKTELRKSVRAFTQILGDLRNIDEAQLFFRSRITTDRSTDKKLFYALSELRSRELKPIKKALTTFDHRRLDRIVRELVAEINEAAITESNSISLLAYFSEVSIRQFLKIHPLLPGSTAPEKRTSRHSLRIAIKKWRYFFEIIAQVLGRDYSHPLDLIKEYQSLLGRMNDIAVFDRLISHQKLPSDVREHAEDALRAEEALLLKEFSTLVEQKPLTYIFLI